MTTKRGEQEHSEAVLAKERLQGAQEAVANEVAAAEPEMPSLLAEPPLEKGRVAVLKFENHSRNAMATVPMMPAVSAELVPVEKRLPPFAYPPVFGGAARVFSDSTPAGGVPAPVWNSEAATSEAEALYEDGLGETTPVLSASDEHLQQVAVTEEEPPSAAKPSHPHKAVTPTKPNAPTLASQTDVPTQPWLPIVEEAGASRGAANFESRNSGNEGLEVEEPETKPISGWMIWSVAVVLSVIVASWVFFTYESNPKPLSVAAVSRETSTPPVSSAAAAAVSPEKSAQSSSLDISDGMRLALAPSSVKSNSNQAAEAQPATQAKEASASNSEKADGKLAKADEALLAPEASQAALLAGTGVSARPKAEQMSNEERVFLAGLEAARKYTQEDQFNRALRELDKIQALQKKYPTRSLEFHFLHGTSLAFAGKDSRQTLKALQILEPIRNAYKTNPDYWRASGFANQVLGMDEARPKNERRKFLSQAKSDYSESLRFGRNNPKYTQARSYIEHIERDLQGLMDDNTGN